MSRAVEWEDGKIAMGTGALGRGLRQEVQGRGSWG